MESNPAINTRTIETEVAVQSGQTIVLGAFQRLHGDDAYAFFCRTANNLLLVGGTLSAIFFGWLVPKALKLDELGVRDGLFFGFWRFMIRFIIPPVLVVTLVLGIAE